MVELDIQEEYDRFWICDVVNSTPEGKEFAQNFALPLDQLRVGLGLGTVTLTDGGYTFRHLAPKEYKWPYCRYDNKTYLLQKFLDQNNVRIVSSGEIRVYGDDIQKATLDLRDAIIATVGLTTLAPIDVINREAKRLYDEESKEWLGNFVQEPFFQ